jgi:hypothetical protein
MAAVAKAPGEVKNNPAIRAAISNYEGRSMAGRMARVASFSGILGRSSTSRKTLELIRLEHPVVPRVLRHRELTKLVSPYARKLRKVPVGRQ